MTLLAETYNAINNVKDLKIQRNNPSSESITEELNEKYIIR